MSTLHEEVRYRGTLQY